MIPSLELEIARQTIRRLTCIAQVVATDMERLEDENERMRTALAEWRRSVEDACVDHGWSITKQIDEILEGER